MMFQGVLFQQSLQDLVKGIRSHRRDEAAFIREKITEIASECRSSDIAKKTNAVLKLTHLQMMGYSIGFASFHIIEVMSASDFASKRIGYLAAAQSFSPTTDVLLLTTNQFKKDLTNGRLQDCSQALTCLAKLVTESLACDLSPDVSLLLSSPRPYVRKKTLLVLYRFIMVYPDTLPAVSRRFVDCLSDPDPGVVCAAVTVTCELVRASPKNFLTLVPVLYDLLTTSSNNWMLIKIVKLMGVLTPLEPRLSKKLVNPLTNLLRNTRAKSLMYECCSTVCAGLLDYPEAVKLCADRLGEFMVDQDQNLKYLGLLSMRKLVKAHPQVAMQHRDLILDCLDDADIGIRMRALELVAEFVTRRTLRDIARILLRKLRRATCASPQLSAASGGLTTSLPPLEKTATGPGEDGAASHWETVNSSANSLLLDPETPYREALADQLLAPGRYVRGEGYPLLSSAEDFTWYIASVLGGLARTTGLSKRVSEGVAAQLTELISRVEAIRPATVAVAVALLKASTSEGSSTQHVKHSAKSLDINSAKAGDDREPDLIDASDQTENDANGDEASASGGGAEEKAKEEEAGEEAGKGTGTLESSAAEVSKGAPASESKLSADVLAPSIEGTAMISPEVAGAAAWVIGEHAELLQSQTDIVRMLVAFPTRDLVAGAQITFIGAILKVYAACDANSGAAVYQDVTEWLEASLKSDVAEVQERGRLFSRLVEQAGRGNGSSLRTLFDGKLLPVDPRAQTSVPVPEGLDLDSSLLDGDGEDLNSYLNSGDPAYGMDGASLDADNIDDEDDLFKQLAGAPGDLVRKPNVVANGDQKENASDSPFYLGRLDERPHSDSTQTGVLVDAEPNGSLLAETDDGLPMSASGSGQPVSVLTGDDGPVGAGLGAYSAADATPYKPAMEQMREPSRYDDAFAGVFDVSPAGEDPTAMAEKKKKKKKKKKKDKKPAGDPAASAYEASLIDLDGVVAGDSGASPGDASTNVAQPRHVSQENDLLL